MQIIRTSTQLKCDEPRMNKYYLLKIKPLHVLRQFKKI